jgi:tryptophan 2,3-dioxygenase
MAAKSRVVPVSDDAVDPRFGESGGRLSYGSYLRIPELLQQQILVSDPPEHDELLFITVHQVYELWFAQMLHELTAARDQMLVGETYLPRKALQRVHVIERVLIQQVQVLETMTPQDFLAFRAHLAPASGFQSVQFRELEFLSGARDPAYVDRMRQASTAEQERMWRRLEQPSLWDAFLRLLEQRGYAVGDELQRRESLLDIARNAVERPELWELRSWL